MQSIIRDRFETDNPAAVCPRLERLSGKVLEDFAVAYSRIKVEVTEEVNMSLAIYNASTPLNIDPLDESFRLDDALNDSGIVAPTTVYLSYSNSLDEAIAVDFRSLVRFFDLFWYPSSDDLSICDPDVNWILYIHHAGAGCCRLFTNG